MLTDISYKDYSKKDDIHGTALYPATMVAPIQKEILSELISNNVINSIFDPFHGSGTALYEGLELSKEIDLFGCDINPLANLFAAVKLQGISENIHCDIALIKERVTEDEQEEIYEFPHSKKWFRDDIAKDLTKIRNAIISINDKKNRKYFWCMLCDIIRRFSNTRSSTYKLHIKKQEQIDKMVNRVINEFFDAIENNIVYYSNSTTKFKLFKCDTLQKIREFEDNKYDISITSPPYGDNGTTVPYGQFSILSLYWIDRKDLELDGWEYDSFTKIDSESMGGSKSIINFTEFERNLIKPYINQISIDKAKKVLRFFGDYFIFLNELCRVTNQFIVMTLGNRTVDRININLTDITMEYLEYKNYIKVQVAEREIVNKRTPKKTSMVNNEPVSSMNQEFVIIYQKNKKSLQKAI